MTNKCKRDHLLLTVDLPFIPQSYVSLSLELCCVSSDDRVNFIVSTFHLVVHLVVVLWGAHRSGSVIEGTREIWFKGKL